jgi:hypothetical protein
VACGGAATNLAVTAGTCTDVTAAFPLPVSFSPHLSGSAPTSCGAAVKPKLNPPDDAVVCSGVTGTASNKCETDEICVPKAGGGPGFNLV